MPDELLHSFIIRTLSRHGYVRECSSILSKTGWVTRPSIPNNCVWLFSLKAQPELVTYFANVLGNKYLGNIFDSPLYAIHSFKKLFVIGKSFQKSNSCALSIQIKYCEHCFKKQIKEYGVTYFKHQWLSQSVCESHSIPLSYFQSTDELTCYNFVLSPLAQSLDATKKINNANTIHTSDISDFTTLKRKYKFAPCAKLKLTNFFLNNIPFFKADFFNQVSEDTFRVLSSLHYLQNATSGNKLSEHDKVLLKYYDKLIKISPGIIELFISHGLAESQLTYIDDEIGVFTTTLYKDPNKHCSTCRSCLQVAEKYNENSIVEITT